jgi:hypothetical protein
VSNYDPPTTSGAQNPFAPQLTPVQVRVTRCQILPKFNGVIREMIHD